eukprot:5686984-Pyramimonas_sp.AAC.1
MFKASQLIGAGLGLLLFVVCMLVELDEAYPKANDMLAIAFLVGAFWAFEVLPLYVTALIPIVKSS